LACDTSGSSSGGGSAPAGKDISGAYAVSGENLAGGNYTGEATIAKKAGNDYSINWSIGGDTQTGSGTLTGHTFAATWSGRGVSGKVSYTLESSGVLDGTWTQDGVVGQGTEKLTPK